MRFDLVKLAVLAFAFAIAFPAHASVIAIFGNPGGNNAVGNFLTKNNYTVFLDPTSLPSNLDAVILLRKDGDADVEKFVKGGGLLITEFSSAYWALDVANLIPGDAQDPAKNPIPDQIGKNPPITLTDLGLKLGLGDGLTNPFTFGDLVVAQWPLMNVVDSTILGTRPGSVIPMMLGGDSGEGFVLVNALGWAEAFSASDPGDAGKWLLNAVNVDQTQPVPEPGTLALAGLAFACLAFARRRRGA